MQQMIAEAEPSNNTDESPPAPVLSDKHRAMLEVESSISPEIIRERGYFTAPRGKDVPQDHGRLPARPGLVVPMFSPDGVTRSYQLRPDQKGKGPKYWSPGKRRLIVDCHPRMLDEVRHGTGPLLITEGSKTGDSATSRGIPTLVLAGVTMWSEPKTKPRKLRPCFDHVRLEERPVLVAFDSDCMTKQEVQDELAPLVAALEARGATVKVIYLPHAPDGSKLGIDDYLAGGHGTVTEMFMLAREFSPADIGTVRMSRDQELRARVDALRANWWATGWNRITGTGARPNSLRGHSCRDVELALIEQATRSGKVVEDGIELKYPTRTIALDTNTSRQTVTKALRHLEADGRIRKVDQPRAAYEAARLVLLTGRATLNHLANENGHEGDGEGFVNEAVCSGGKELRAPRLRWSDPGRKSRAGLMPGTSRVMDSRTKERPPTKRLGKVRGAILDALDAAGGTATLAELCEILHRSRPRDLIPRKDRPGPLLMLVESNIITIEDDRVTLVEGWRAALDDARKLAREIDDGHEKGADTLTRERYDRERAAFRDPNRHRHDHAPTEAEMDAARKEREQGPDGHVEDLRPLSPLAVALDGYLRLNTHKVTEYSGWLASTLNVYGWTTDNVTRQDVSAAIEELGGDEYRRSIMELARTPEDRTTRRVAPLARPAPAPARKPPPSPPAPELEHVEHVEDEDEIIEVEV